MAMSPIGSMSKESKRRLLLRIWPTTRRAWNEGVLPLVGAMMLATLAVVSLRLYWIDRGEVERRDQEVFKKTFGVQQEERELPFPGVVSGLLGAINDDVERLHCAAGDMTDVCRRSRAILDAATYLFDLATSGQLQDLQLPMAADCGKSVDVSIRNRLLALWAGDGNDEERRCAWIDSALAVAGRIGDSQARPKPDPCPQGLQDKPHTYGVGVAGCELPSVAGEPATLIPAQSTILNVGQKLYDAVERKKSSIDGGLKTATSTMWETDAVEVLSTARILDAGVANAAAVVAREPVRSNGAPGSDELNESFLDGAELRQAYFISPDDTLRIWTLSGDPIAALPRSKLWSNAAYLRPFHSAGVRGPVRTRAYLDVGGNGLVVTECRPLWLGPDKDAAFIGAVCADITLNILKNSQLQQTLALNHFLHIEPIVVSTRDGQLDVGSVESDWIRSRYTSGAAKKTIVAEVNRIGLATLAQTVKPVLVDGESVFIVPIGKYGIDSLQALLVAPQKKATTLRSFGLRAGVALGTIGYFALTLFGFARKKEDDARRNDMVILRSLQIGVIESLADGEQILRANDRAEELLGVMLPKERRLLREHLPSDAQIVSGKQARDESAVHAFTSMYDCALEIVRDKWPDVPERRDERPEVKYRRLLPEDIRARRRQGRTSRYWIRLSDAKDEDKRWLFVQAGPVVREASGYFSRLYDLFALTLRDKSAAKPVGTFGTIARASGRRVVELEEAYKHLMPQIMIARETHAGQGVPGARTDTKPAGDN